MSTIHDDETPTSTPVPVVGTKSTRDSIRAAVLGENHLPKSRDIMFFGQMVELRQSTLADVLEAQSNPDRQAAIIRILVERTYVPGTDEKVFEEADADVLKALPWGADFIRLSNALTELTDVNFLDGSPGLKSTPSA